MKIDRSGESRVINSTLYITGYPGGHKNILLGYTSEVEVCTHDEMFGKVRCQYCGRKINSDNQVVCDGCGHPL